MKALVVHNEGDNFSVGVNLGLALFAANIALWPMIEDLVRKGQEAYKALKYRALPGRRRARRAWRSAAAARSCCIAPPSQAHAETYMGLVEVGVGVDPRLGRLQGDADAQHAESEAPRGPMPPSPRPSRPSAPPRSRTRRPRRKRADVPARRRRHHHEPRPPAGRRQGEGAGVGARTTQPPEPTSSRLPGPTGARRSAGGRRFLLQGKATPHDVVVAERWPTCSPAATPTSPRPSTEDQLLELERQAFMSSLQQPATLARMEHMLATGKPLRN